MVSLTAFADNPVEDLEGGATLPEVLRAWGQPLEKVDRDVKREVIWRYSHGAFVKFKDGRVVDWRSSRGRGPTSMKTVVEATPAGPKPLGEMGDLVRDIAKEVPGGPDAPFSDPPGGGAPGQPAIIPNQIPPAPPGDRRPAVSAESDVVEEEG